MRTNTSISRRWGCTLVALLWLLSGCTAGPASQTPAGTEAVPSPSATPRSVASATPVPTVRPTITRIPVHTPKPTRTRTPTPTLLAEAIVPQGWPSLPADLYFLRDGRLWRWPAEGGIPRELPVAEGEEAHEVIAYRLTPDGRTVAYRTSVDTVYVLDRPTGEQVPIPIVGQLTYEADDSWWYPEPIPTFALTSDGRYLVYAGGGEEPSIRVADVRDPDHQLEFACQPFEGSAGAVGECLGFTLSPDGRQLVYADGKGIWVVDGVGGEPRLLLEHDLKPDRPKGYSLFKPVELSPDGRWLLVALEGYEWLYLAIVEVRTGQVLTLPETGGWACGQPMAAWGPAGLWVSNRFCLDCGDLCGRGLLYLARPSEEGTLAIPVYISETVSGPLWPTDPLPLPTGGVAFAHQECEQPGGTTGPAPAVFLLQSDGTLQPGAPLPRLPWGPGAITWTVDGSAFLYTRQGRPILLGFTDGSALWDVHQLLRGAHDFRWAAPAAIGP